MNRDIVNPGEDDPQRHHERRIVAKDDVVLYARLQVSEQKATGDLIRPWLDLPVRLLNATTVIAFPISTPSLALLIKKLKRDSGLL